MPYEQQSWNAELNTLEAEREIRERGEERKETKQCKLITKSPRTRKKRVYENQTPQHCKSHTNHRGGTPIIHRLSI